MRNGESVKLKDVPVLGYAEFREKMAGELRRGARIASWFAACPHMYLVLAHDGKGVLEVLAVEPEPVWRSVCAEFPQAGIFERELAEGGAVRVEDHPWLKPVRVPRDEKSFFRIDGGEVHEIGVGPVMGDGSMPAHYRFQCHGEKVLHLEVSLGYLHRGIEKLLLGVPNPRTVHYVETLCGDCSVGHASACCLALEALAGEPADREALKFRALALELERLAHHVGDIGGLCEAVSFMPPTAYCKRLMCDYMEMTAALCGNSFGRGMVRPGGIGVPVDRELLARLYYRLEEAYNDTVDTLNLMRNSPSVMGRFEHCGILPGAIARQLGMVGPAARASGVARDVRVQFPLGDIPNFGAATGKNGDVYDRAKVRWLEIRDSGRIVSQLCGGIDRIEAAPVAEFLKLRPAELAVALVEGWRGEICHTVLTGDDGAVKHYKIVDPSFHNWTGLEYLMRGGQISDFPLCSRSFNLSGCGYDL